MSVYYFVPVDDEGTYESPEPFEHRSLRVPSRRATRCWRKWHWTGSLRDMGRKFLLRCAMIDICRLSDCHSN